MQMVEPDPQKINSYWKAYLEFSGDRVNEEPAPEAWGFGDSLESADELGRLVVAGPKRATTSLFIEYEVGGDVLPEPGQLNIILDGRGEPLCIIEITGVEIKQFDQVEADFAFKEAAGDRSLAYWREVHLRFFTRRCKKINMEFHEEMPVVCEEFRVVFPLDVAAS